MARSDKNSVGRAIAETKAKTEATLNGDQAYSTKSGGWKSGQARYEPSKKSSDVTRHKR